MSGIEFILYATWPIVFIGMFILCCIPKGYKPILATGVILFNSIITSIPALQALTGSLTEVTLNAGSFIGTIPVRIDGLSAWFILIINFTSITGAIYGIGYLKAYDNTKQQLSLHWSLFALFHLSMVWVCLLQNGFAFLIVWEIMSLSSMMLVIFEGHKPKTLKAGLNYLVQMHISVVLLTIGFIWLYIKTGSFNFDAFSTFFGTNNNRWLFLIFFAGFGLKAGFIPLHSWLPHAHPAAPSHVSGVMSGVIVKLGIYGIIRIITFLKTDYLLLGEIVLSVSIVTGLFGILNAAVRRDFKRMLAYCTIENIGIIGIGIGLGLMGMGNGSTLLFYFGFGGALLHVLNHSLYKSLLFFSAGSVYQQAHTRNMDKLGGLIKQMPKTALFFLIGAIAIVGLPPFNGFVSEFIIYNGLLEGFKTDSLSQLSLMVLTFAGLSLIGGISIIAFSKTYSTLFLGSPRVPLKHIPREVSKIMLVPQYFIVAAMLCVAFFPQWFLSGISNVLQSFNFRLLPNDPLTAVATFENISKINRYSLIFVGVVLAVWAIRTWVTRHKQAVIQPSWGCGYVAPNNRMQYTGKSFAKTFAKTFSFLIIEEKTFEELKHGEIFPTQRKYSSQYHDFFEIRFFNFITQRLIYGANYFKFIQNGRVQSYVLYGIIFILSILALTVTEILK